MPSILAILTLFSFEILSVCLLLWPVCTRDPGLPDEKQIGPQRQRATAAEIAYILLPLKSLVLALEKARLGKRLEPRRISRCHMSWFIICKQ